MKAQGMTNLEYCSSRVEEYLASRICPACGSDLTFNHRSGLRGSLTCSGCDFTHWSGRPTRYIVYHLAFKFLRERWEADQVVTAERVKQ